MPRISQIAAGAFAAALAFTSVASFAAGSSDPETDQVKSRVVERLGVRPTTVAKTPFGLWEISVAPDQVFYVDGNVRYLLLGNAVDIATRENLTEKRIAEISRVDWKTLPQKDAIRVVHGSGRYQVAVFADATCMYCRAARIVFREDERCHGLHLRLPHEAVEESREECGLCEEPGRGLGESDDEGSEAC